MALLTPSEVAERLRAPESTVRCWVARGVLPVTRLSERVWRVDADALEQWIAARSGPADDLAAARAELAARARRRAGGQP
jgi:excisionase family DNA binding protein